jgi:signal transduction histidine kinase
MNKLWIRLTLSFLGVTLLVIGLMAFAIQQSVSYSFDTYVTQSNMARFGGDLMHGLEDYYAQNETWQGVESLLPTGRGGQGNNEGEGGAGRGAQGAQIFVADTQGIIVASTQEEWVGANVADIGQSRQIDLMQGIERIGILGEQTPGTQALNQAETRFLQDISTSTLLVGILAGSLALGLAIALAYTLMRPLNHLTQSIAKWRPNSKPPATPPMGTDEIKQLHQAFVDLLERLAQGEQQRQQMSADIAHELRTPVTIMRGHLEAMMDGVYPLDVQHLAVGYDQVLHLARLVEDLRLLTRAEAGQLPLQMSRQDLLPLIQKTLQRFEPLTQDHEVNIMAQLPTKPAWVNADVHRLQQVFDNLISNAIRHTPTQHDIHLAVVSDGEQWRITLTNPTVTPLTDEQVGRFFDRFWRAENSRERDSGGSGLGLAITRELLRLQGGTIHAERAGNALRLVFVLPLLH